MLQIFLEIQTLYGFWSLAYSLDIVNGVVYKWIIAKIKFKWERLKFLNEIQ